MIWGMSEVTSLRLPVGSWQTIYLKSAHCKLITAN
jgi:hypothetical protein